MIKNPKLGGTYRAFGSPGESPDENDTDDAIIDLIGKGITQNAYQTLKHAGTFDNQDNLGADRFTDANGVKDTVNTGSSTAFYDSVDDKYIINDNLDVYVIIEASSLNENSFKINNCDIAQFETGKWVVYCVSGTLEERRTKIYKTLFYGSNDVRNVDSNGALQTVTSCTAIKTNISRDIGKRGHFARVYAFGQPTPGPGEIEIQGTFQDTTNNLNCSAWSFCQAFDDDINEDTNTYFELPTSTVINSAVIDGGSDPDNTVNDETELDRTGDEIDNPANLTLKADAGNESDWAQTRVFLLSSGDITWSTIVDDAPNEQEIVDYFTDYSIPEFTEATETIPQTVLCDSNIKTLTGNEKSICVYADEVNTANTSITYDVSDGTTTISDLALDTVNGIDSLGAGQLEITFNLSTTDNTETPELYGYSYYIN